MNQKQQSLITLDTCTHKKVIKKTKRKRNESIEKVRKTGENKEKNINLFAPINRTS